MCCKRRASCAPSGEVGRAGKRAGWGWRGRPSWDARVGAGAGQARGRCVREAARRLPRLLLPRVPWAPLLLFSLTDGWRGLCSFIGFLSSDPPNSSAAAQPHDLVSVWSPGIPATRAHSQVGTFLFTVSPKCSEPSACSVGLVPRLCCDRVSGSQDLLVYAPRSGHASAEGRTVLWAARAQREVSAVLGLLFLDPVQAISTLELEASDDK